MFRYQKEHRVMTPRFSASTPAGRILRHLQRQGACSIKELEAALGVSATAVREPLSALKAEGLVTERAVRGGAGRPYACYSLTTKAQSTFAREYDLLVTMVLREMLLQVGPERTDEVLARVAERLAEHYGGAVAGESLRDRLEGLHHALEQKGIPAEVVHDDQVLMLFACPYYDLVQEHPSLCAMEQQMLGHLLNSKVTLEQSIRDGHHCCRFAAAT